MFVAMVMACVVGQPELGCAIFTDRWGPHKTQELCKARAEKMIEGIIPTLPQNVVIEYSYKCANPNENTKEIEEDVDKVST